jgi:hypothetical protein
MATNNNSLTAGAQTKTQSKTVDFTAFRRTIVEDMCAVRVLLFAFGEYETMRNVLAIHDTLRKPIVATDGTGERRCVLVCRMRQGEWAPEQTKAIHGRGPLKWVAIDPETLKANFDDPGKFAFYMNCQYAARTMFREPDSSPFTDQQWDTELEILPALLESSLEANRT